MEMAQNASGLAASIRASTESTTFDLAGQNTGTITTNISSAFQEPLPVNDMIRITFVTGAGKLARQKYDENAAKALTTALRSLGFEEDRGASCVKECAGSFKLQHDTGKNLKTVVVFPHIQEKGEQSTGEGGSGDSGTDGGALSLLFPKGSPEEMVALSSMAVFKNIVKSRCSSWSQKKGCTAALSDIKTKCGELEAKLMSGTPLSDAEQALYDTISVNDLDEKMNHLRELMHEHVDSGNITAKEKRQLLDQVKERIDTIQKELSDAEQAKQPKKVEKLKGLLEKSQARSEKLSKLSPSYKAAPLKHHAEISKLRTQLKPLLELEANAKGRLLSVSETQSLGQKDDILEEIAQLEENSRGWFEDEDAFQERVNASKAQFESQSKAAKKKPTSSGAGFTPARATTPAWLTTTTKPKSGGKTGGAAKKSKAKGSGIFAAMLMDSDSD